MNTSRPPAGQSHPKHSHGAIARQQSTPRRRAALLTDDQYLATSLALVADLSRRVRGGAHRHG